MYFVGVSRDASFSEGRVTDDAAIFNAVAQQIQDAGYDVVRIPEDVLVSDGLPSDLAVDGIFHMTRSEEALKLLDAYAEQGVPVFNTPDSVRNCHRTRLYHLLTEAGVLMPCSGAVTSETAMEWNSFPCWVKGERVRFASDKEELLEILKSGQGKELLLQAHCPGAVVKFYGVGETFFSCRQITDTAESRFGQEGHNDLTPASFNEEELKEIVFKAALATGLDVYGGDAIITPKGDILIVDLNDWPSFRSCRDDAARAIWGQVNERSMTCPQKRRN